jgi:hypothetical protein
MIDQLISFCTSNTALFWLLISSDILIASSYFAIPITMAVVLRHRRADIPYPWLWALFVVFIVACGLTHVVHIWSAFSGVEQIAFQATIGLITAAASAGTAIAFANILPSLKALPSPAERRAILEAAVAERTAQSEALLKEINHRIGNQLQVLGAMTRLERKRCSSAETQAVLNRIDQELAKMGRLHLSLSERNYGDMAREIARVSAPTPAE